jgi:flagellar biosynthesis protein FlhF
MKIKRYTATSMRQALALVRAEQGPDAVILSSRRGDEGIEVIAAIDYDEALFSEAKRQTQAITEASKPLVAAQKAPLQAVKTMAQPKTAAPPVKALAPAPAKNIAPPPVKRPPATPPLAATRAPAASAPASAAPRAVQTAPAPLARDFSYTLMQREMREMRRLLESGFAGLTWQDKRLREPLKAQVLEQLSRMEIAPDVAQAIAEDTPRNSRLQDTSNIALALLIKHLHFVDDASGTHGGITALVGPTGTGKTTTIAKLAARWCMNHGSRDLALISTDAYRIGAREQLATYAGILDAPMFTANTGKELARLLTRLNDKRLILIDTAGMGPRDLRLSEQLAALKLGAAKAKVMLALPAQAEAQALEDIVRAFARANPSACIITKIDEAASLGAVLSAAVRHRLKIAYLCDGQKVPEDLHAAQGRRVWLAKTAQQMKEGAKPRDEAYMAHNFGKVVTAHA